MKKLSYKTLFDNKRFLQALSLLIAMLCWLSVAMSTDENYTDTITNVPVNIDIQASAINALGLNVIEGTENVFVQARVQGPRNVVGKLTSEELTATTKISNITAAGTYLLDLTPASVPSDGSYRIISYFPQNVEIRFDRIITRSFNLETAVNGFSVMPGYMYRDEYATPRMVEITGPQAELDKVARCRVAVNLLAPLQGTFASVQPIELLDVEGKAIDPKLNHLTLSQATAQLVVPVDKISDLPLRFEYLNGPQGFPLNRLFYTVDPDHIEIAGPSNLVDQYQEINLGYIDFRELTEENSVYAFDIVLPSGSFTNIGDQTTAIVEFDSENWDRAQFNVSLEDLNPLNQPAQYKVQVSTKTLYNVTVVGDAEILPELTADDIVVQLDLAEKNLTPGQTIYPVKLSLPTKGLVWVVGNYSVVLQITDDQE